MINIYGCLRAVKGGALAVTLAAVGVAVCLLAGARGAAVQAATESPNAALSAPMSEEALLKEVEAYKADPAFRDDAFVLETVKEAVLGVREHNGGIGACLVRQDTGEVLDRAHNSQYQPYFRSDLHAEMQLMDRYEDRMRLNRNAPERGKLRDLKGVVLYTSVEPCPMCLARLINAGVKKIYYAHPDEQGGMAKYMSGLPPYWRQMAAGMVVEPAQSSPRLNALAKGLFHPMHPANAAH